MGILAAPASALLDFTEAVGKKVEQVGLKYIPGACVLYARSLRGGVHGRGCA
jgi:hypothetical protein